MVTAEMKYRTHVPYGWIAIMFCDIKFYNDTNEKYSNKWHDIEFEKYYKIEPQIEVALEQKRKLTNKKDALWKEFKSYSKWYRPWKIKEQKNIEKDIRIINIDITNLDKKIEYLEKDKWYDVYDLIHKGHKFLEENGFHLKSHTENGRECITNIEIWEKE